MPFPVSGLIDLAPWSDPGACFWVSFGDLPEHIHMYTQVYTLVHIYSHLCTHMYTCIHVCTYAHTQSFLLVLSSRGWSPGSHCLLNRSPNTPLLTTLTLGFPSMGQTVCSLLTPEDLSHFFFPKPMCVCLHAQSCLNLCEPTDCSPPGSSVHGISQATILEWVAISSSRGSSQPSDWTHTYCVSFIGRRSLCHWAIGPQAYAWQENLPCGHSILWKPFNERQLMQYVIERQRGGVSLSH